MNPESEWYKSSFSGSGNCVEVKMDADAVSVRHTRDRDGSLLTFSIPEWNAFVAGVHAGEFSVPSTRVPRRRSLWPRKK